MRGSLWCTWGIFPTGTVRGNPNLLAADMPLAVKSDVDAATTTWSTLLETCIKKPSYLYTWLPTPSFKKCGQLGSKRNVAKRSYSAMAVWAHRPITLMNTQVACNSFASGHRHLPLISCKVLGTADYLRTIIWTTFLYSWSFVYLVVWRTPNPTTHNPQPTTHNPQTHPHPTRNTPIINNQHDMTAEASAFGRCLWHPSSYPQ